MWHAAAELADAVHNETSIAVEQVICDNRFRTRYGWQCRSGVKLCRRTTVRLIAVL